jgi:hypothetical protein
MEKLNKEDFIKFLQEGNKFEMTINEFVVTYFDYLIEDLFSKDLDEFYGIYQKPCKHCSNLFNKYKVDDEEYCKDGYKIRYLNSILINSSPLKNRNIQELTGLSSGTINNYRKGYAWMTNKTLEKISNAIRINLYKVKKL